MKILFDNVEDAENFIDTLAANGTAAEELIVDLIDKGHKYLRLCKQIEGQGKEGVLMSKLKAEYFQLMRSPIKRGITPYDLIFFLERPKPDGDLEFYTQTRLDRLKTLVEEGL